LLFHLKSRLKTSKLEMKFISNLKVEFLVLLILEAQTLQQKVIAARKQMCLKSTRK